MFPHIVTLKPSRCTNGVRQRRSSLPGLTRLRAVTLQAKARQSISLNRLFFADGCAGQPAQSLRRLLARVRRAEAVAVDITPLGYVPEAAKGGAGVAEDRGHAHALSFSESGHPANHSLNRE
jgi:hypothetical protein